MSKNTDIPNFIKSRSEWTKFSMRTDRQTDRLHETVSRVSKFCEERAQKVKALAHALLPNFRKNVSIRNDQSLHQFVLLLTATYRWRWEEQWRNDISRGTPNYCEKKTAPLELLCSPQISIDCTEIQTKYAVIHKLLLSFNIAQRHKS
jgi:hypothetical protein